MLHREECERLQLPCSSQWAGVWAGRPSQPAAVALLVVDQDPGRSSWAFPRPWSCSSSLCFGG